MMEIILPRPADTDTVDLDGVPFAHRDIFNVVDDFYTRVQNDPILKVPFGSVTDWPEHIEKLTHFWWVRFGGEAYFSIRYNPIGKHFIAGFNRDFLKRWLSLFHETLKIHLNEQQSLAWKDISERMGQSLAQRNDLLVIEHQSSQR